MSQRVPNWDVDDNPTPLKLNALAQSASPSLCTDVPSLDYEVAELTWENGQLAMHGLGPPRVPNKLSAASPPVKYTWEKPHAGGTLESVVSQAARMPSRKCDVKGVVVAGGELVPWFDHHNLKLGADNPAGDASVTVTMDALVPCAKNNAAVARWAGHDREPSSTHVPGFSGHVGSSSGVRTGGTAAAAQRGEQSVSLGSATYGRDSQQVTVETCEMEFGNEGFTSTSMGSPENTSSDKQCTNKSNGDSVCHSRPKREIRGDEEHKKKGNGKSSVSTRRSRAAAVHNQSERKRRDKINQRMKTLQKLVPNSSKTDKASMLDEVIEYLKQLQAHVHMMNRMNMNMNMDMSPMMFPLAMQQQLQMSMMGMNMGMAVGMGSVMDMSTIAGRSPGIPPFLHPAAAAFMPPMPWWENNSADRLPPSAAASIMPPDPLAAFLASQQQPMMTMDAYSRMAALYQQQFQQAPGGSKN